MKNLREHPTFSPDFVLFDRKREETITAPYPVTITGIEYPYDFLSVGKIIGSIQLKSSERPVIEAEDITTSGEWYTLVGGVECYWDAGVPDDTVDRLVSDELVTSSIREYLQELRGQYRHE